MTNAAETEGADNCDRQLRGDKGGEPISGVTNYCRVLRKGAGKRGSGCGGEKRVPQTPSTGLIYDILPSTTAVFSYSIGPRKLSANEQLFVGAQTVVSLLQTTQLISHVCFITNHVAYASSL